MGIGVKIKHQLDPIFYVFNQVLAKNWRKKTFKYSFKLNQAAASDWIYELNFGYKFEGWPSPLFHPVCVKLQYSETDALFESWYSVKPQQTPFITAWITFFVVMWNWIHCGPEVNFLPMGSKKTFIIYLIMNL